MKFRFFCIVCLLVFSGKASGQSKSKQAFYSLYETLCSSEEHQGADAIRNCPKYYEKVEGFTEIVLVQDRKTNTFKTLKRRYGYFSIPTSLSFNGVFIVLCNSEDKDLLIICEIFSKQTFVLLEMPPTSSDCTVLGNNGFFAFQLKALNLLDVMNCFIEKSSSFLYGNSPKRECIKYLDISTYSLNLWSKFYKELKTYESPNFEYLEGAFQEHIRFFSEAQNFYSSICEV